MSTQQKRESEGKGDNRWEQGKTGWVTTFLVPRPHFSVWPNCFGSGGRSEDVNRPFTLDTSLK